MKRNLTRLISLGLVLVTLVLFWPVRQFDFVNYDDPDNVSANAHVLEGLTGSSVEWAFTNGEVGMWVPLTWLSLMADTELYGRNASGYHLTNLFLHTVATLLLFGALRRLTGDLWRSGFVAALFAWHPFHVESVAWITERRDVLSGCFWMATLWLYARYAAAPSPNRYLLVLAVYAMGLMSKPMLVTLPAALLLLDWWPLRRSRWRWLVGEKIPLLMLGALISFVTLTFQAQIGSVATMEQLPLGTRAANAVVGYARYLGKTLWPTDLAVFYPYAMELPVGQVAGAAVLLAGITAAVVWQARCRPSLPVGWFWFLGTLFPVVGLFQAGSQSMADHYSYVPIIGLFVMAAWSLPARPVWVGAGGVALLACALLSRQQLATWRNSETLFRHALTVTTGNWVAHQNLGEALEVRGRDAEAEKHYRAALALRPENAEAHFNLANVLTRLNRPADARWHYRQALHLQPAYPKAHVNLGNLLLAAGQPDAAIRHYRAALVLQPELVEAHNNVGLALAGRGEFGAAIRHFEAALRLWPDSQEIRSNLADARRRSSAGHLP